MRFLPYAIAALTLFAVSSCSTLGRVISLTDPETGEVTETTVGNVAADTVEQIGGTVSNVVGDALGVATGNPVVGLGGGAGLLALFAAGASRLRRPAKKKAKPKGRASR